MSNYYRILGREAKVRNLCRHLCDGLIETEGVEANQPWSLASIPCSDIQVVSRLSALESETEHRYKFSCINGCKMEYCRLYKMKFRVLELQ
jgi:hypothetical protein